jgi:aryl sulfotransferase
MKLLQSGMAKSGNYWLYTILQSIMRHAGLPTHTYISTQPIYTLAREWELSYPEQASIDTIDIEDAGVFYRISSAFRWPIQDLNAYLEHATHVWTHSAFGGLSDEVFSAFDKIVYIVRDPRDVVLSTARFLFTPYMQTFHPHTFTSPEAYLDAALSRQVRAWRQHVGGHLSGARRHNIYFVFYERLLHDFKAELAAMCRYLGIEPSPALLDAVQHDVAFEHMQESSPGHVRKGTPRQWVEQISTVHKATAVKQAGPMLALLGYPVQPDGGDAGLPSVPNQLDRAALERAMAHPAASEGVATTLKRIARRVLG